MLSNGGHGSTGQPARHGEEKWNNKGKNIRRELSDNFHL